MNSPYGGRQPKSQSWKLAKRAPSFPRSRDGSPESQARRTRTPQEGSAWRRRTRAILGQCPKLGYARHKCELRRVRVTSEADFV
jgi:hypothetical protein